MIQVSLRRAGSSPDASRAANDPGPVARAGKVLSQNNGLHHFAPGRPGYASLETNPAGSHGNCDSQLTFVPTDFGEQTLSSALQSSGFRPVEVGFFSWLGVTPYLTAEAAMATLAFIGSLPAGSGVVFDYAVERSSFDPVEQMAMDALASRVAQAGGHFDCSWNLARSARC
jgi:hypothetical protein